MNLKQLLALGILAKLLSALSNKQPIGSGLVGLMGLLGGRQLVTSMMGEGGNAAASGPIVISGGGGVPNYGLPMPTPIPTIINPIPRLPF